MCSLSRWCLGLSARPSRSRTASMSSYRSPPLSRSAQTRSPARHRLRLASQCDCDGEPLYQSSPGGADCLVLCTTCGCGRAFRFRVRGRGRGVRRNAPAGQDYSWPPSLAGKACSVPLFIIANYNGFSDRLIQGLAAIGGCPTSLSE